MKLSKIKFLIMSVLLSAVIYGNPNNVTTSNNKNWKNVELTPDLDKDGKKDKIVVEYLEENGKVNTKYTVYVKDTNDKFVEKNKVSKTFSVETFEEEFDTFTRQLIKNHPKKSQVTEKNEEDIEFTEKNEVPSDLTGTPEGNVEITKEETGITNTTTKVKKGPYEYITYYVKERPSNLTFNYKYDKNSPKDLDEFVFIKTAAPIRKEPNANSKVLKNTSYAQKYKVIGKVKAKNSKGEWYEVSFDDGKVGYILATNAIKREFDWHDMMKKVEKTNKFIKEAISKKQKIYVLDDYTPLGGGSGTVKDKFGNRENQSEKGYTSTSFKEAINIPDRSIMTILEETDSYIKVKIDVYDGVYYLKKSSKKYLKDSGITSEIKRFIYMDRNSQNEMIIEKNEGSNSWNVVTTSFVTTGKDGASSYATPYGTFLVAYAKPVMQYTGSKGNEVVGDAKNAIRFTGGGYMHSIPSLFEPKATRNARKAATAKKIGTFAESHKCVRHYDDQIKFIYDWLGNSTPKHSQGYRVPTTPTVVLVK